MSALLQITGLRAAYGKIVALKGVDLEVNRGEIVALIGSNGAGKSTLMMSVFGQPRAQAGHIVFDGQDITHVPTHEIARLRISQAPEGRRIFPRMSVMENLQMGADAAGDDGADKQADLDRVLSLFPILEERLTQRGGTLSGGEQQMLAIGRALMSRPRLLMLDEPSLGLAPLITRQIFDAIRQLNRNDGLTVLIVEQNANHALRLAHRGYVMVNGTHHAERNGQRTAAAAGNPRRLSRGRTPLMPQLYAEGSFLHVLFLTFVLGCGCAWAAGRAIALSWRPAWIAAGAMVLIGFALRFLHFALFQEPLLEPVTWIFETSLPDRGRAAVVALRARRTDGPAVLLALRAGRTFELAAAPEMYRQKRSEA